MFTDFFDYFLKAYSEETLLVRHKARILLSLTLFLLLLIEPAAAILLFFSPYSYSAVYPMVIAAALLVTLFFLKGGRHTIASHLLLVAHMAVIWTASIHHISMPGQYINKLAHIFFVMGFLSIIPIVIRSRASAIIAYDAVNITLTFIYLHFTRTAFGVSLSTMIPYYTAITLGLIIISFSTYILFRSHLNIYMKQVATEKTLSEQNNELKTKNSQYERLNMELVESRIKILEEEERYRDLYENAIVGMITVQYPEGIISKMNGSAIGMLGCTREEYLESIAGKMKIKDLYCNPHDRTRFLEQLKKFGNASNLELQIRKTDGSTIWVETSAKFDKETNRAEAVISDITYRKNTEENLHRLTFYDSLTDLPNREMFVTKTHTEILKSLRKNKEIFFAVMCLGIDHFKKINEMHGTIFGDTVLKYIADRLQEIIRDDDVIARYEGDKFQILFSDIASSDDIIEIVRKTTLPFNDTIELKGISLNLTASIGICFYPDDGIDPETLLKNSETAMFTAKERGRNSYQIFNSKLNDELLDNIRLEQELHQAIRNSEFVPYFQPKVNHAGALQGMESLIRWNSPSRGIVNPFHFIPLVEKNGMINEIGRIMLRESCLMMKQWHDMGLPEVRVAVNISPAQFRQEKLIDMIRETIEETKLPPSSLELEITESGIMEDEDEAIRKLHALHEMGISISIDDFGTGYSSLSKLKDYPIDTVKIDKSFIDNLPGESRAETITTTIIDLAHNLGFKVVAEGIETVQQLSFLEQQKCDQYQGYFFSHPLPADEFEIFYRNDSEDKKN